MVTDLDPRLTEDGPDGKRDARAVAEAPYITRPIADGEVIELGGARMAVQPR